MRPKTLKPSNPKALNPEPDGKGPTKKKKKEPEWTQVRQEAAPCRTGRSKATAAQSQGAFRSFLELGFGAGVKFGVRVIEFNSCGVCVCVCFRE